MKTYVYFTRFQTLLYYFANLIGLAPFSVENNILRPVSFPRKVYTVILVVLSLLWGFIIFIADRSQNVGDTSGSFVNDIYVILLVGAMCSSLLITAFKSNEMVDIINKWTEIKDELKNFGIEDSRGKYWTYLYAKIIATNGVLLLVKVFSVLISDSLHGHELGTVKSLYWFWNITTDMNCHNMIVIFAETINCIRQLFESLNNKLQGTVPPNRYFLSSDDQHNSSAFRVARKRHIGDRAVDGIIPETGNIRLSEGDVERVSKLHGELCALVESTTQFYTVPILLAILRHFSRLLSNCYLTYMHLSSSRHALDITETIIPFLEKLVCLTTVTILEVLLIANASTSICRVGNATKTILHKVWNKFYPEELTDEFYKFSLQLLHKPVAVSAFGFFDLDHSILYKIFGTVVAYLIIMIQFDTSELNPGT